MNKLYKVLGGMTCLALAACASNDNEPKESTAVVEEKPFSITTAETKVAWNSASDVAWSATDEIESFDNNGKRLGFATAADKINGRYAQFDKKAGQTEDLAVGDVTIFYPSQNASTASYTISAEGQSQNGNNSFAHLADYTFMRAEGQRVEGSNSMSVVFSQLMMQYKWSVGVPVEISPENVAGVRLESASNAYFSDWTYAMTNGVPDAGSGTPTNQVNLDLTGITADDATITAYMLAVPTTLTNETVNVVLYNHQGKTIAYKEFTGVNKTYESGKQYDLTFASTDFTPVSVPPIKWSTDNLEAATGVTEVKADDGISKIQYININSSGAKEFDIIVPSDNSDTYLSATMGPNAAWVLECPLYDLEKMYTLTFDMKSSVANSKKDLILNLHHSQTGLNNSWTRFEGVENLTFWAEYTINADGTTGALTQDSSTAETPDQITLTQIDVFHRVKVTFKMPTEYTHDMLYLGVEKANGGNNDNVGIKFISLEEGAAN